MTEGRMHNNIKQAVDHCLSGVQADPFLMQRVLRGEKTTVKKKLTVAVVFVTIMSLITVVAIAVGIYEWIKPRMDQAADILIGTDWKMEDKMKLIDLMIDSGVISADNELYLTCMDESQSNEERERAATQLIDSIFGETIRSQLNPSVLQQEEYPSPDLHTVYAVLYRIQNPDANDSEIDESFECWLYGNSIFSAPSEAENTPPRLLTEEDVTDMAEFLLSEIYNFNRAERAATQKSVSFDESRSVWMIQFTVQASDLRPALRAEWISDDYDPSSDSYAWTVMISEDGSIINASSIDELDWNRLIPREAYPQWDQWKDELRAFMYCSTEERAQFSAIYKPVVDTFLEQHPSIAQYFAETPYGYAEEFDPTIYMITRQKYGVPGEENVSELEAIATARQAYISSGLTGVSEEMVNRRCLTSTLYIITDRDRPIWKVEILASQLIGESAQGDHRSGYRVLIDATTGELLEQGELIRPFDGRTVQEEAMWSY